MKAILHRWAEALGVPGIAGIGLAVCALAFHSGSIRPAEARLASLDKEKTRLEQLRSTRVRQGAPATEASLDERLQDFYALLARPDAIGKRLETIDALARQHGVVLRQGNYRFNRAAGARFGRYEVTYTGQSAYFQARLFLRDVLRELPMLSLDDVAFQRQQTSTGATELTARFSLLVKAEPRDD